MHFLVGKKISENSAHKEDLGSVLFKSMLTNCEISGFVVGNWWLPQRFLSLRWIGSQERALHRSLPAVITW